MTQSVAAVPTKLNFEHSFATKYFNKVMLSTYTMEFYNLDPSAAGEEVSIDSSSGEKDYSKIVWV